MNLSVKVAEGWGGDRSVSDGHGETDGRTGEIHTQSLKLNTRDLPAQTLFPAREFTTASEHTGKGEDRVEACVTS